MSSIKLVKLPDPLSCSNVCYSFHGAADYVHALHTCTLCCIDKPLLHVYVLGATLAKTEGVSSLTLELKKVQVIKVCLA